MRLLSLSLPPFPESSYITRLIDDHMLPTLIECSVTPPSTEHDQRSDGGAQRRPCEKVGAALDKVTGN